jgi:hypothetical protein
MHEIKRNFDSSELQEYTLTPEVVRVDAGEVR